MRIGELAESFGMTTKTLRFYEKSGVLPAPIRDGSGYRNYDDSALARLRFVRAAQSAGLTLSEIRAIVAIRGATGPPCAHVTELLESHLCDLDRRILELSALRAEVHRLRERARTLDPAGCGADDVCHLITARG